MKQRILNFIIPLLVYLLAKLINKTLKLKVIGEDKVKQLKQEGKRLIYACWHGRTFILIPYMANQQIAVMTSLSQDGEYLSRIFKKFRYRVHRGSYTRGGVRGLLGLIRDMKAGYNVGFAVDGPTGPIYEPKEGIIFFAKKTQAYIVPLTAYSKNPWIFKKAWDKFMLPKPFSQAIIIFDTPYQVYKEAEIEKECKKLKEKLETITNKAEEVLFKNNQ